MVRYVRMVMHHVLEGEMKNGTVSRTKSGKYFVSIQVEVEIREPIFAGGMLGLDLGLRDFVTLSSEEKVRLRLARLDERIANQRRDYHHKLSHQFVEENQFIGLDDLNIQGMTSSGKIHRRCWLVSIHHYVGVQR